MLLPVRSTIMTGWVQRQPQEVVQDMRNTVRKVISASLIMGAGIAMSIPVTSAQELRPYEPPSTRTPRYQQFQTTPPAPRLTVDDAVYERFWSDIQKMDATERTKLTASLRQQLQRARQDGRYREAIYYERLLEILERAQ